MTHNSIIMRKSDEISCVLCHSPYICPRDTIHMPNVVVTAEKCNARPMSNAGPDESQNPRCLKAL